MYAVACGFGSARGTARSVGSGMNVFLSERPARDMDTRGEHHVFLKKGGDP